MVFINLQREWGQRLCLLPGLFWATPKNGTHRLRRPAVRNPTQRACGSQGPTSAAQPVAFRHSDEGGWSGTGPALALAAGGQPLDSKFVHRAVWVDVEKMGRMLILQETTRILPYVIECILHESHASIRTP